VNKKFKGIKTNCPNQQENLFYKYLTKNPAPEALVPDVIEDIEE